MLRVALTGGIGSGKSTAAGILRGFGAEVSSSDEIARGLMEPGQRLYRELTAYFGAAIVRPDGLLDRVALARLAFDEGRVEEINAIVHPVVIAEQQRWLAGFPPTSEVVAVVETALLFETRHRVQAGNGEEAWAHAFDRILLVAAPVELRLERYLRRFGASEASANAAATADFHRRAALQMSDEQKAERADVVVQNDGSIHLLEQRLAAVWDALLVASRRSAKIEVQERPGER